MNKNKFSILGKAGLGVLLVACLVVAVSFRPAPAKVAAAAPGDVIINELMYNPGTGVQTDEYIELYNTTNAPIDMSNWSFSAGVTCPIQPGIIIGAHDYIIISPYIFLTLATYGVTNSCSYISSGTNLSNGGETVTLVDDTAQVINSVTYDDVSPWPSSPDGLGPSLELKAPGLDNSIPTNWAASTSSGGTPLAQNSLVGLVLPVVTNVSDPANVTDSEDIDITAEVTGSGISAVELKYKINFDTDITLAMYDDGAHNDGAASDDVYGAQIPAQAQKTLVRFKVEATNGSGVKSSPSTDESIGYYGYYIKDPSVTSVAPIIDWFISDDDYQDLITNHRYDNVFIPSVIVYNDNVYDNSRTRIRGDGRDGPKFALKMKLPPGYEFDLAGGSNIAIGEFELLSNAYNTGGLLPTLGWMTAQTGLPNIDYLPTLVQKNGDFQGTYVYANKYQSQWRQANGYNSGELYEDAFEIVSGANSLSRINQFRDDILSTQDINATAQRDYVLDNFDIPKTFNFMSALGLVSSWDHYVGNNMLQYYDADTGRWSNLLWDQEGIYKGTLSISPYDNRGSSLANCWSYCPVYNQPELRDLYLRRFRTLTDKLYTNDSLLGKFQEQDAVYQTETNMDITKWPVRNSEQNIAGLELAVPYQKNLLLSLGAGFSWVLPAAQTDAERQQVYLDVINPDSNNSNEYIRISNNADTPVDLSNWVIEGIDYEVPAGAVVPANGSIYLMRDDIGYKAGHSPVLVGGQYTTDLGSGGTLTLKTDAGATIDSESY